MGDNTQSTDTTRAGAAQQPSLRRTLAIFPGGGKEGFYLLPEEAVDFGDEGWWCSAGPLNLESKSSKQRSGKIKSTLVKRRDGQRTSRTFTAGSILSSGNVAQAKATQHPPSWIADVLALSAE